MYLPCCSADTGLDVTELSGWLFICFFTPGCVLALMLQRCSETWFNSQVAEN